MNTLSQHDARAMLNKVPEVTMFFWIIKIIATTVGETADFLNVNLNLGLTGTSLVMGGSLVAALCAGQGRKYIPSLYWVVVVLLSIFRNPGNRQPGGLNRCRRRPPPRSSAPPCSPPSLPGMRGKTLDSGIVSPGAGFSAGRRSCFCLRSAPRHKRSRREGLQLGYAMSAVMFGAVISAVTIAHYALGLNAVLAFWIALHLTRPSGASCGDLLLATARQWRAWPGHGGDQHSLLVTILGLVGYLAQRRTAW